MHGNCQGNMTKIVDDSAQSWASGFYPSLTGWASEVASHPGVAVILLEYRSGTMGQRVWLNPFCYSIWYKLMGS